ncbi:MAG: hypothetical protein HYU52_14215 [Acidobacteria bacterium]|nr:hypothetical protein [Acidobacteriota bacterium]
MAPDEALAAVGRPFARTLHSDTNVETWLMKASAFNQAGIPHNATVVRLAFMKGRLVEITGL